MAVIEYEGNGQAYFVWLEDITSAEFVEAVSYAVTSSKRVRGVEATVSTTLTATMVEVVVFDGRVLVDLAYFRASGFFTRNRVDEFLFARYVELKGAWGG